MPFGEPTAVKRSSITNLANPQIFDDTQADFNSITVDCSHFREFILYLGMVSAGTPTTIQFIPQFSDDGGTTFFNYLQGIWASMFFEDTVMTSAIGRAFDGKVVGRLFRLRIEAVGTTAVNTFTASADVEFRN